MVSVKSRDMRPRWLEFVWVSCAAACTGFLAAAMSGTAPPWWVFVVPVALSALATLGARASRPSTSQSPNRGNVMSRGERTERRSMKRLQAVHSDARAVTRRPAPDLEPREVPPESGELAGERSGHQKTPWKMKKE